jgi:protein ImuB
VVRLACISVPRVDLQVLALRHPDWKQLPAAVVSEEKPLGRILMVNRAAQNASVRPGMRYASALSICPQLRAGVVLPEERETLKSRLVAVLRGFTPEVEPSTADAALFWVNATGLERLYPSLASWAGALEMAVRQEDLVCSVAVGFTRFGTYASAKSKRALTIFGSPDQERAQALRAPAGVLPLDHEVLLRFQQLGIYTVRDFNRFSSGALRRRFGRDVERLQLFARGEESLPVQPVPEEAGLRREMRLLYPEGSAEALLQHLSSLTAELITAAQSRREFVSEIVILLCPEFWPGSMDECLEETLRSAKPGSNQDVWDRLLRLRFESLQLPGPIVRLAVQARTVALTREQVDLFAGPPKRDPAKALAAIADVCAELGNDAVQVAELRNHHLPEEQFCWNRVEKLSPPVVVSTAGAPAAPGRAEFAPGAFPTLVRRILHEPVRYRGRPPAADTQGSDPADLFGPYVISGGWWMTATAGNAARTGARSANPDSADGDSSSPADTANPGRAGTGMAAPGNAEGARNPPADTLTPGAPSLRPETYHREYHFLDDDSGRVLWLYHDRKTGNWMVQGVVE